MQIILACIYLVNCIVFGCYIGYKLHSVEDAVKRHERMIKELKGK